MARGVFATQMYFPGDLIEAAEIIPLSVEDTQHILGTLLRIYTYAMNETQDCIVLGNGCLYNHSDEPNVTYSIDKNSSGRTVMTYRAKTLIKPDDQLFISYLQDDGNVDLNSYNIG